ncbi:uncharacterized protein LOC120213541 [Hibiscus syriacus]|uniref:uncharacterized protein LOC120213541 n=1 Tax=Hibiscus syriacus TaxID=106335 RepID=UPI001924912A|nr:uncharacterized protein LOC120213541 [Hibiscus syriacus]
MDSKGIICFIVGLLGLISSGFGFAAEITRVKPSQVKLDIFRQCEYPQSHALVFSLVSAATLLIAQIIINAATQCFCCKRRTAESHMSKSLCFYIISWITFMIAIGLLLTGAKLNERHDDVVVRNGAYYCYVVKPGVFVVGAIMAALSSIFGVFYYQTINSKGEGTNNVPVVLNQGGRAMAQPQFPRRILVLHMDMLITSLNLVDWT